MNILPTGILRTTPVGVFPYGISELGLYEPIGKRMGETSSAKSKYPYDHQAMKGRKNIYKARLPSYCPRWFMGSKPSKCQKFLSRQFSSRNMVRNYIGFRVAI